MDLAEFFSIQTVAFTLWGYEMSWIELLGTIFGLWSVWLTAKQKVLCWPVGIVNIFFFMLVFYQVQLYSDVVEQLYYFATTAYGWWAWKQTPSDLKDQKELEKQGLPVTALS